MTRTAKKEVNKNGLQNRIRFIQGNAENEELIGDLGKFNLIYSTFSLHHWKDPMKVIRNCLNALTQDGVLFLYDLRRVWWLYSLPIHNGFLDSIRAAYIKTELQQMVESIGVENYEIKSEFPFMQLIICKK